MEITIQREALLKAVARIQGIIERRSTMPILSAVLLRAVPEAIILTATDLEMGIEQELPASIYSEGSITVPGRKLYEILRESSAQEIKISEMESHRVRISDGATRFELATLPADEFPLFESPGDIQMVTVPSIALKAMITKTIYAVTLEEAGFKLSGVYTEKLTQDGSSVLRMVATDGHRLSMVDATFPELEQLTLPSPVMIPKKGMNEVLRLAQECQEVSLGIEPKTCLVRSPGATLMIRLLETRFPDYRSVIPKQSRYHVSLKRLGLLEGMRKMLILSNERYRAVKILLEPGRMDLLSTNPEIGEGQETLAVDYEGESMEIGFNPRYFVDALQPMESEIVVLGLTDSGTPCIITGEADEGFLGLIMPMRV